MTTTEAHHEIARDVAKIIKLRVHPEDKFLLKRLSANILEHALAMRRCRDNLDRAREAKRVEVVTPVVVAPAPPPVPVVVVKVEKPKKPKSPKGRFANRKKCRVCGVRPSSGVKSINGNIMHACDVCAGGKS